MNPSIVAIEADSIVRSPLPFSAAIQAGGFLFVSGMASVDRAGRIINDSFENEARRTYQNLASVLAAANTDFRSVVQVRCYLNDKEDWEAHNQVYREFFAEPYPARTTLIGCLGGLVKYEVDLVAYVGNRTP